jgi:hypothetical protein
VRRSFIVPSPNKDNITRWATDVHNFLRDASSGSVDAQTVLLQRQIGGEKATTDGLLMWDQDGYPVVSKDDAWHRLAVADYTYGTGNALFGRATAVTAAAANTAYAILFDAPAFATGISRATGNLTRIVFANAGLYRLSFTAQMASSSASSVELRFWPRVNGTNVGGSTMVGSLHNNGATTVISRDSLFQFAAGDYLEAMWATSSTSAFLEAHAATAYAPASPSVTMAINRVLT